MGSLLPVLVPMPVLPDREGASSHSVVSLAQPCLLASSATSAEVALHAGVIDTQSHLGCGINAWSSTTSLDNREYLSVRRSQRVSVSPSFFSKSVAIPTFNLWDARDRTALISELSALGFSHYADKLSQCGEIGGSLFCNDCGHTLVVTNRCDLRICPDCNKRRFARLYNRYMSALRGKSLRFLTLTAPNVSELVREDYRELRDMVTRFRELKWVRERILGGFYSLEVTHGVNGWNLHVHMLYEGAYMPQSEVSKRWEEVSGCYIVDIRRANVGGVKELIGYSTKSPRFRSAYLYAEYLDAISRTRLVQGFGSLFNIVPPHRGILECPDCGGSSWTYLNQGLPLPSWYQDLMPSFPPPT